jgi:hypothetical protein
LVAGPASASKNHVTEERDVVIKPDPFTTLRTGGRRIDNRFFVWDAMDANIKETAQNQAEQKREYGHCGVWFCHRTPAPRRGIGSKCPLKTSPLLMELTKGILIE